MTHLTVKVLIVEAAAAVTVGLIGRLMYRSRKLAIARQNASAAREVAGYAADVHRHKHRGGV